MGKLVILDSTLNGEHCLNTGSCSMKLSWRYDNLEKKNDPLDYAKRICKFDVNKDFDHYTDTQVFQSHYQRASFIVNQEDKDTCFDLDDVYQICTSYRPHYHEMVVHYTARYLKDVTRVVWVGGGDSMLLHEILQYENLELVIGLEIDQKVTRASFKYFGTQPHWDDPRVQWWYGDAAKSLLMLPEDYFGSFDLVLVDLSESVTSHSVTEELDVFDALSLLLKPEGIMVKNEVTYIDSLTKIFKYAVQIHYNEVPVICGQYLSIGSNNIDFLYTEQKDFGIDSNLYIQPLEKIDNHYAIWTDYRRNSVASQLHCKNFNEKEKELITQGKSPGIIMILEVEDVTISLESSVQIKDVIVKALVEKVGVEIISSVLPESNDEEDPNTVVVNDSTDASKPVVVVIMAEGYVVARAWPEHNYCALDIHVLGSFQKHELMKEALLSAFETKSYSSYRIVAGGMLGVPTWKEDEKNRGPRKTHLCYDTPSDVVRNKVFDTNQIHVVLEKSLALLQDTNDAIVAVICGNETQPCDSMKINNDKIFKKVVPLVACPDLQHASEYSDPESHPMIACEEHIKTVIEQSVTKDNKIGALVLDPNAPSQIAQIVLRVLYKQKSEFFAPNFLALAMMPNTAETWRRNWLERIRTEVFKQEPLFRAEVLFNTTDSTLEMGVTSSGDERFVEHLVQVISDIEKNNLESEVKNIYGGLINFRPNFDPHYYTYNDYDQKAPLLQWNSQQPVGLQTVYQIELVHGSLTPLQFQNALNSSVQTFHKSNTIHAFNELGEGSVIVSLIKDGTVVATFDGDKHIDLNIFTLKEDENIASRFVENVRYHFPTNNIVLLDEQPRGYGRVVSFLRDIEPRKSPSWV